MYTVYTRRIHGTGIFTYIYQQFQWCFHACLPFQKAENSPIGRLDGLQNQPGCPSKLGTWTKPPSHATNTHVINVE